MTIKLMQIAGLQSLTNVGKINKEVQLHWRLMLTRFITRTTMDKRWQKVINMHSVKAHFINLNNKNSPLVAYLLKHSDKERLKHSDKERLKHSDKEMKN